MEEILLKSLTELMAATGVDYDTAMYILGIFVKQSAEIVEETSHELEKEEPNWEVLVNAFHKLKGSAGNVRLHLFHELAIQGERYAKHKEKDFLMKDVKRLGVLCGHLDEAMLMMSEELLL